ncbi:hypothetical protein MRX96_033142 [Rhipicephalus microplus]
MSEPVPTVCGASSAPKYLLALNVPSIYWSCHRVAHRTFPLYCKLKMDGNEIASERVVIFSHDGEDNQPGVAYTAYLWVRMAEKGHVAGPEEAEDVLRNVDSYAACKGALSTKSMQKCDLTRGLQEQVTTHEGTYFSKRCVGKGPSEGTIHCC